MRTALHVLSFGLLLILTGCITLYKPNAIHSPLLKEKGELNTSASIGMSGCGLYNLQAAYALSNHTGVMINGMSHYRQYDSDSGATVEKLNILSGEAGVGYFTPFGDEKNGLFQCYGGGGYGVTTDKIINVNPPDYEAGAKYFNIFIQPGLAYTSKYFEVAFDLRTNYVRLFDIHADLFDVYDWWDESFNFVSDTTLDFINLEPAITIKAGGENLKGFLQLGATIPTYNSESYFVVNSTSLLIVPLFKASVGVTYTFGRK